MSARLDTVPQLTALQRRDVTRHLGANVVDVIDRQAALIFDIKHELDRVRVRVAKLENNQQKFMDCINTLAEAAGLPGRVNVE